MKLIYLKSALKCNSFDIAIGIKIPFNRVLVTIEPGRSLLQFVTANCLIGMGQKLVIRKELKRDGWEILRISETEIQLQEKI